MIIDLRDKDCFETAKYYLRTISNADRVVGLITGVFDLTHVYHIRTLRRAKRKCNFLIVGVDSDDLVRETKGDERPIFNELHRAEIIDSCKYVDMVFIMDNLDDLWLAIKGLLVNRLFKNNAFIGQESQIESNFIPGSMCKVYILRDIEELTSTTQFVRRIQHHVQH